MLPNPTDVPALAVHALMPLLRAMEAEAAVEALATVVAEISRAACPSRKLAEAQDALSTACWRYRISTGRDGLEV